MSADTQPIGILGGTFDPIHDGHLRPALEVMEQLGLAQVRFIPCRMPPHREQPVASPAQRLAMLQRAVAGQPGFVIDRRELDREGPSYMVDTLISLRVELGDIPLCLIVGMDAFVGLPDWYRWRDIPGLAHLVVLHRPGASMPLSRSLGELVAEHKLHHPQDLEKHPAGGVLFQPVTQLDIAATGIRALLARGRCPRYLLPEAVRAYIDEQGLYCSSSSTSEEGQN